MRSDPTQVHGGYPLTWTEVRYLSIVDHWFDDSPGGMARVAADHAHLVATTADVTVACIGEEETNQWNGVNVIRIPTPQQATATRRLAAFAAGLRRRLRGETWDVIHVHSAPLGFAGLKAIGKSPRLLFTVHSPIRLEMEVNWRGPGVRRRVRRTCGLPILNHLERTLLEHSAVHTLSHFTQGELNRLHGPTNAAVIPHWIHKGIADTTTRAQARACLGWPQTPRILLTVRGHKPRTGIEDLIAAAAPALQAGECRLVIGGSGPLTSTYRELAKSLQIDEAVSFPGRLSDDELELAYRAADLFVLPTRELECFGLVTIEAAARGLPVIASDAGATPEILSDLSPDLLYPAGRVDALRERIRAFLDGALEAPAAKPMKEFIASRYGYEQLAPRFLDLVEKTASG